MSRAIILKEKLSQLQRREDQKITGQWEGDSTPTISPKIIDDKPKTGKISTVTGDFLTERFN